MTTSPDTVTIALSLLDEGRPAEAEALVVRQLQTVTARHGEGGPEWAAAQCDLGTVRFRARQPDRAVECFRRAVSGVPRDAQSRKDQLTYRLNLGLALRMAGRLDEAEDELREGLRERLAFYGRTHAGYAFGLEPLAGLLRERGDLEQARRLVDEAVANLWGNSNEQVASALALRAAIVLDSGSGEPLFTNLQPLPEEVVARTARAVVDQLDRADPRSLILLRATAAVLEQRLGADHRATLDVRSVLAGLGRDLGDPGDPGDPAGRAEAIAYDREDRPHEALTVVQGLAEAFREFVTPRLPAGLLARLDATLVDGRFTIGVGLRREPTQAEVQRLDEVLRTAQAEFRQRLGRTP